MFAKVVVLCTSKVSVVNIKDEEKKECMVSTS